MREKNIKCEYCGSKELKKKVWHWEAQNIKINMFYCSRCMVDVIPEREQEIMTQRILEVY